MYVNVINDRIVKIIDAINGYSVTMNANNITMTGIIDAINSLINLFSMVLIIRMASHHHFETSMSVCTGSMYPYPSIHIAQRFGRMPIPLAT